MAQIEIITGLGENGSGPAAFNIAGIILRTDAHTPTLQSFALDRTVSWEDAAPRQMTAAAADDPILYAGRGWVTNAWREIECRRTEDGYHLRIFGLSAFWIREDGQRIIMTDAHRTCPKELLLQSALGAPFVLALALQDIFCLHVSLVQAGDRFLAFAGESGQGKSTLAQFLGFESGLGWKRIIDDMLPVKITSVGESAKGIVALPHFPQLKVPGAEQPVKLTPPRVPISALYILDSDDGAPVETVQINSLTRRTATLAVVQHTIAARLYDRQLLARHLEFCDIFAATVPVRSLIYPRRFEILPDVGASLQQDLAALNEG